MQAGNNKESRKQKAMGNWFSSNDKSSEKKDEDIEVGTVKWFHTKKNWETHFNNHKNSPKLVVIYFTALWCPPCRLMAPVFETLAKTFTDVEFVKMDVDEIQDVAKEFKVETMPTFVFLKKGEEVERLGGAYKDELKKMVEKHRDLQAST